MFIRHDAEFWAEFAWEDTDGYLNFLTYLFKKLKVFPDKNGSYWSARIEDDDLVIVTPQGEMTALYQIAGTLEDIISSTDYYIVDKFGSTGLLGLLTNQLFERRQTIDDC